MTKQAISVFKVEDERLEGLDIEGIDIEIIGQGKNPLSLGSLRGNKFEIAVRDLDEDELVKLNEGVKGAEERGVPNYFGKQRFGRGNTHLIGRSILRGELDEAVKGILCFLTDGEFEDKREWRTKCEKEWGDWANLANDMPRAMGLEWGVVDWLSRYDNDYAGAMRTLPKHLRKLYVQAYQSYLWNAGLKKLLESGEEIPEALPVPGLMHKGDGGVFWTEILELMKKDELELEDFKVKRMPKLAVDGIPRESFVKPDNLKVHKAEDDELNPGKKKVKFEFELGKGRYATTVVESLF
jgi:tRNA pseudouridine13 synthase